MTKEEAIEVYKGLINVKIKEAFEFFVPELRESEDERIRKWLITQLGTNYKGNYWASRAIEYLEKQKEQTEELSTRLNGLMQEYVKSGKNEEEQEHRLKCYQLFWDALSDSEFFEQKERKPVKEIDWTRLTWKDINELERIINNVHYEFPHGIGEESFGKEVLERFRSTKGEDYLDEKEQKPILEVFGFKVGDAVRLKDGDGRKHIIKSFEEVEGVHGPNFYHVEFEDDSARDGIYPGEEYPNGYYTQMEKFEEEQKSAEYLDKDMVYAIMKKLHKLAYSQLIPINSDEYKKINEITSDVRSLLDYPIEQKPVEWSEEEIGHIYALASYIKSKGYEDDGEFLEGVANKLKTSLSTIKQEWSEEDKDFINMLVLHFNYLIHKGGDSVETYKSYIEKLKSLRPDSYKNCNSHWKPSEEQIGALNYAYCELFKRKDVGHNILGQLQKLCDELNKLM